MNITFAWQGFYESSMSNYGSVLDWTPTPGSPYLIMVSSTASSGGNNTRGVSVDLRNSDNLGVLIHCPAGDPNPPPGASPYNSDGPQTTQAKSYDGDPATMPMVLLTWMAPTDWPANHIAAVTVNPYTPPDAGKNAVLQPGKDWLSVTIVEVDQLPDR